MASIIFYEEISTLGKEYYDGAFLKDLAFKAGVEDNDKEVFIYNILQTLKDEGYPTILYPVSKDGIKVLKKTGFAILPVGKRNVFIKPLTSEAEEIFNSINKIKTVNIFMIC